MKSKKTPKIVVTLRVEEEHINKLKSFARRKSVEEEKDITYVDIIRDLIKRKVVKI